MSFADLKKQSRMGSLTEKLVKQVEKMNSNGSKDDNRFWKPVMDKSGVGSAVIRFLPAPEGSELPWAQVWSHAFQGPGGWLIDNCLTTLGQQCPVCEKNRVLWNSGSDADKEEARKQKRKLSYFANIYVVRDPANPENQGKVFLYKFGKKIFDKIMAAMQPEFDDEQPINPFDFWEGANFKLKLKKVAGYWNYDASEFAAPSALLDGDDDELENLYKGLHDLNTFVDPKEFKSYDDLKKRLDYTLGLKGTPKMQDPETQEEDSQWERERKGDFSESTSYNAPKSSSESDFNAPDITMSSSSEDEGDDDDDALSYFQKLAES
jgi:hypothetical protein